MDLIIFSILINLSYIFLINLNLTIFSILINLSYIFFREYFMKVKNYLLSLILFSFFIIIIFFSCSKDKNNPETEINQVGQVNSSSVNWEIYDEIDDPKVKGTKFVMLFFYSDWCPYCKKMLTNTFTDKQVIETLNNNFISVKINGESDKPLSTKDKNISGRNLLISYQITGFPTAVFLDKNLKPLTALPGYVEAKIFNYILKYLYTESYKTEDFETFVGKQK